jgi:hypothetical protein
MKYHDTQVTPEQRGRAFEEAYSLATGRYCFLNLSIANGPSGLTLTSRCPVTGEVRARRDCLNWAIADFGPAEAARASVKLVAFDATENQIN